MLRRIFHALSGFGRRRRVEIPPPTPEMAPRPTAGEVTGMRVWTEKGLEIDVEIYTRPQGDEPPRFYDFGLWGPKTFFQDLGRVLAAEMIHNNPGVPRRICGIAQIQILQIDLRQPMNEKLRTEIKEQLARGLVFFKIQAFEVHGLDL